MNVTMETLRVAAKTLKQAQWHENNLSTAYNYAWNCGYSRQDPRMQKLEHELDRAVNGTEDALQFLHTVIRSHNFTSEDWLEIERLL